VNIVLIQPEIPNNTGNIGRLALGSGCTLHLVKPFGFEINDTRLKRAGLDYWQHLEVYYYENIDDFFSKNASAKMVFLSSHGTKTHFEINYTKDLFLVFGKESKGLPDTITEKYTEQLFTIPMFSKNIRSFNLANAVGIVVYEGIRQLSK